MTNDQMKPGRFVRWQHARRAAEKHTGFDIVPESVLGRVRQ